MKIVVTQLGARRHYAVPMVFQKHGCLEHFYTDFYLKNAFAKKLLGATDFSLRIFRSVAVRNLSGLEPQRVSHFPIFAARYFEASRRAKSFEALPAVWAKYGSEFCQLVRDRLDPTSLDAIYAYSSAALELFEWAKSHEIRCILDHGTAPLVYETKLTQQQCVNHPKLWEPIELNEAMVEYGHRQRKECELADVVVCNSSFVADAVACEYDVQGKCVVVPLGVESKLVDTSEYIDKKMQSRGKSQPLRVLFVGDDPIRKGLGDLSEALKLASANIHAKAVGKISLRDESKGHLAQNLEVLGAVPRSAMEQYYRWADVLVLPSVSDTFAIVVLEALSFGVPVITTKNTGASDVLTDSSDSFIVPINSPAKIAEKLDALGKDMALLIAMSKRSIEVARQYELGPYGDRLMAALEGR